MNVRVKSSLWAGVALVSASLLLVNEIVVGAEVGVRDVLDQPARLSERAASSLFNAVVLAGTRLVAVGERGIVLLSDDNGRSWRQAGSVPVSVALTDVDFVSATHGWAVGHSGVVLHSDDGGETWMRQLDGNQAARVILDDAKRRVEAGEEGAAAALSSAEHLVSDGPDKPFLGLRFVDELNGYVVGAYGIALATRDGGKSWQSLVGQIPNPRGKHLYQVRADGSALLIAGEQGALFRSENAGASFRVIETPYEGTFFGALDLRGNALLAYGLRGNAWRSGDAGESWEPLKMGQPNSITSSLSLANGALLLADEGGRLLRSNDGGQHFVLLPTEAGTSITGMVETRDGVLVLSGAHGLVRVEADAIALGAE